MEENDELLQRIDVHLRRPETTKEQSAALVELRDCLKRTEAMAAEFKRKRVTYWGDPAHKEVMNLLFGTSTVQ